MKIKPLIKYTNATDFLRKYLVACGVNSDEFDKFIQPNLFCFSDPFKYKNIEKASIRLDIAIRNREEIGVLVDSDTDGYASAATLYQFLRDKLNFNPIYFLHTGKQHGLRPNQDENLIEQIANSSINLLFIPDAGSSDGQWCKILKQKYNIDTIVLDHHEFDTPNTWAIVVNNQIDEQDVNKSLSGCGVTAKFIEYYCKTRGLKELYMIDMVACSLVSDSMDLSSLENRTYVYYGLEDVHNPLLKTMAEKMNRRGNTPNGYSFGLIPPINALQRSNNQAGKVLFFEALIGQGDIEKAVSVAKKAHRVQLDTVKTMAEEIESNLDLNHKVIIGFTNADNKEYIGLVANKIQGKYHKPTILLREAETTTWSGSMRSPIPIKNIINESGLAQCEGHQQAAGIYLKKSNLPKLIKFFDNLDLDVDPEINVACELGPKQITKSLCSQIENNNLMWGQGLPKPQFYIKAKINSNDIQIFKKRSITVKIVIDGIDFILFFAKEEDVDKLTEMPKYEIETLVELGLNEWNGVISPQALIQKYEVNPIQYDEDMNLDKLFI